MTRFENLKSFKFIYQDYNSSFVKLLKKDISLTIYQDYNSSFVKLL